MKYVFRSEKSIVLILLALGVLVHALWFGHPNSAVFDEVHFGKFLSSYFTHEYYFDIHPPLGKLMLAGWGKLWGFKPGFSFAQIGDVYPDNLYMALRFLPMLAGALLPLLLYGIAREFGIRKPAAFLVGVLVALDNAILVQSRFILLDSFLLLFGFGAIWAYFRWRNGGTKWLLIVAGLCAGGAMSIKWTGITFLGLILIGEAAHLWKDRYGSALKRWWIMLLTLIVLPLTVYVSAFAIHFALLKKSGTGDAFMTTSFQHGLVGNLYEKDMSLVAPPFWKKFIELNVEMYRANTTLTATHPYSSPWYTWPLMARPIFYWVQENARIYLIGNPIIWWASTIALLSAFMGLAAAGLRHAERAPLIMTGAWLMNMLPFIGIHRVMFLYHYLTALIWAILLLAWLVDHQKNPRRTATVLGISALVVFVFFAPLTYGLSLSPRAYNLRVWLKSWR